jgi:hypothetical protein
VELAFQVEAVASFEAIAFLVVWFIEQRVWFIGEVVAFAILVF